VKETMEGRSREEITHKKNRARNFEGGKRLEKRRQEEEKATTKHKIKWRERESACVRKKDMAIQYMCSYIYYTYYKKVYVWMHIYISIYTHKHIHMHLQQQKTRYQ